jgi:hypothetical protein
MYSSDASDSRWIDGTLYPDTEPPATLRGLAERVDFLARPCAAWEVGLLPDSDVVAEVRRAEWREAYHLLRRWYGLAPLPYLGRKLAYIRDDPNLAHV